MMGGSGGGGGAGQVSWPDYLQATHGKWLDGTGDGSTSALSNLTYGMTTALNNAAGASGTPFPMTAYGGTTEVAAIQTMLTDMDQAAADFTADYSSFVNNSIGLFDAVASEDLLGTLDPTDDFQVYEPGAAINILDSWNDPLLDIVQRMSQGWELIPVSAWTTIRDNWEAPGQLLTPDPNANTRIVSEWSGLGEWENYDPTADQDIVENWGDLEEWIDPTVDAAGDIQDNWEGLVEWIDPTLDAASDITTGLATEAHVAESTNEFGNVLDDQITSDVLPRFEAGMRDINAVMSSAFVIGRSLIEGMRDRDVAKYQADLRYKAHLQRDALLGQAYMQDDQINSTSVLEENRANLLDVTERNKLKAQAFLQDDQINSASVLENNRSNVLSVTERNKMLAQAYLQNDQLLAQSVDGKNKTEAMAVTERNKLVAQALIQDDQLLAANISEKNKIYAGDLLEKQKMVSQAVMQNDDLWVKQILTRATTIAGGITDENKILAEGVSSQNKAIAESYLQEDRIEAQGIETRNKIVSDDYKTKNVIVSDFVKNRVLTVFQMAQAIFDSQALGLEYIKTVANMRVEGNRINYVINKEANDKQIELDINEARWDLDVFQPAANLLAAVSGGTGFVPSPTPGASALGGAFSGAAIGARVSNNSPIGAGAGAVLGGIGGYLLGK